MWTIKMLMIGEWFNAKIVKLGITFLPKFTTNTYDSSGQADTIQMWSFTLQCAWRGGGFIYKIHEKDIFPEGCIKRKIKYFW